MGIDYRPAVRESTAELLAVERQQRGSAIAERVKRLRLLKTESSPGHRPVATVGGYPERQLRRWGRVQTPGGRAARRQRARPGGRVERLEAPALAGLEAEMTAGRIGRRRAAPRLRAERYGVHQHGVSGLSRRCQRPTIKLKPGRRRPRPADAQAPAAFKTASPDPEPKAVTQRWRRPRRRCGCGPLMRRGLG